MATQSPFSLLEGFLQNFNLPITPPTWAVQEMHRRTVLLLNHVLMQEPQAMERLARQKARVILARWRAFTFKVVITPAGLLDLADAGAMPDLTLEVTEESPLAIAQTLMQGGKPAVQIAGDVQLAAEVNWLADHLRWDIEEDLASVMGDALAHGLVQATQTMIAALRKFVGSRTTDGASGPAA